MIFYKRLFLILISGILVVAPSIVNSASSAPSFQCGFLEVPISPGVPGDSPIFGNQINANCFAWWEFISLNWPEGTGSDPSEFGKPGDMSTLTWQMYMDPSLLFPENGKAPPEFGTQPTIPAKCKVQAQVEDHQEKDFRHFNLTSKFVTEFLPEAVQEAAPGNAPNWLGAQNGTNVWYEIRINKDEYDYIIDDSRQFYNAENQRNWVDDGNGQPIILTEGVYQGVTGSIELKAAWMEALNAEDSRWDQYKLSAAVVVDPSSNTCRQVTVALVGLHIIHKTASQNTWVWATFEHQDNVPDSSQSTESAPEGGYNFYNSACQAQVIDVPNDSCLAEGKTSPVTVECTPNVSPPYYIGENCPGPVPIQVTRANGVAPSALQVNQIAQQEISKVAPDSVWQYYDLVNVIWSSSTLSDPTSPVAAPEPLNAMESDNMRAVNTTMETYVQDKFTCTDCHQFAPIAKTKQVPNPKWASDFTFMLQHATSP